MHIANKMIFFVIIGVSAGSLTVRASSEIDGAASAGVFQAGGSVLITQSSIHDNASFGVLNTSPAVADARNNFWGDSTGPLHSRL